MVSYADFSIVLVAGESSGDLLAEQLLIGLRSYFPSVRLYGIGGPHMIQQGFVSYWPMDLLTVRGIFEVIPRYFSLRTIQNSLKNKLLEDKPLVFIGVDYPGFNLGLELQLREFNIPTVHFISPQIWAWRAWRIKKIAQAVSHMLVIFPFEAEIYRKAGVPVTYVGHPLAKIIPIKSDSLTARKTLNLAPTGLVITILPGSRISELKYNTPCFLEAIKLLAQRESQLQFIAPMAGIIQYNYFLKILVKMGYVNNVSLKVMCGNSRLALEAADGVIVASGTAALEAALYKKPMVIAYKMLHASYMIMRYMNYQPWIGLPNILAREFIVPEFLQNAATPLALVEALWKQLNDPIHCRRLQQRFLDMHYSLLRDTVSISANSIYSLLQKYD